MTRELEQLVKHMQEALGGIKDLIINNSQDKYQLFWSVEQKL